MSVLIINYTHLNFISSIFFIRLPVSFHWCVTKQCHLPSGEMCSPMMEYRNSCSLIVNHRFNDAGQYCVNSGVVNDVSGTNTSLMVQIPGGMLPVEHKHSARLGPL